MAYESLLGKKKNLHIIFKWSNIVSKILLLIFPRRVTCLLCYFPFSAELWALSHYPFAKCDKPFPTKGKSCPHFLWDDLGVILGDSPCKRGFVFSLLDLIECIDHFPLSLQVGRVTVAISLCLSFNPIIYTFSMLNIVFSFSPQISYNIFQSHECHVL